MAKLLSGTRIYGTATVDTQLIVSGTATSTSTTTGALIVTGGAGFGRDLRVGGSITATSIFVGPWAVSTGSGGLVSPYSGIFTITNTTNASSTITGALQVAGGAGIGRDVWVGGIIEVLSNTNASSTTTGALQIIGGAGIGGNLYVGGEIVAQRLTIQFTTVTTTLIQTDDVIQTTNTTNATSTTTGALVVAGGAGVGRDLRVGGSITATNIYVGPWAVSTGSSGSGLVSPYSGIFTITNTTSATSTITGALQVAGGVGIGGDLWIGGTVYGNITVTTIPQNSQSADYTLVAADAGKHILHPSSDSNARTYTIPANSSVAYAIGTSITFVNETSQILTISITTDTMYLAGSGLTGSRTLAQYGVATALKTGSTTWYISGTGLS